MHSCCIVMWILYWWKAARHADTWMDPHWLSHDEIWITSLYSNASEPQSPVLQMTVIIACCAHHHVHLFKQVQLDSGISVILVWCELIHLFVCRDQRAVSPVSSCFSIKSDRSNEILWTSVMYLNPHTQSKNLSLLQTEFNEMDSSLALMIMKCWFQFGILWEDHLSQMFPWHWQTEPG